MEIILMTNDWKLLLSKDNTSEKIVISKDIEVDYSSKKLIIKLKNDYEVKDDGWIEVKDNWDIYI